MFTHYFLTPLLATVLLIAMLVPVALKTGFTDKPCHRKQHKNPTPIIGGLAIYLSLLITFLLADTPLPGQNAFLTAVTLLVGVGLIDDYKNLSVKIRLVIQISAALIMVEVAHLKITSLGDVFGMGDLILNDGVATVFTVFAVVGGINAFNMIDGMDGLSGTLTFISIAAIAEIAWVAENWALFQYCLIFMGGIIGFLLFNMRIFGRPNAKIFLGDTGSTVFGFTVCWLAIGITQEETSIVPPITALWLMGLPLIDSVCIMLRRISKGRSPFNPDREHLHHLFVVAGYSINFTLGLIAFIAATIVINGIAANLYMKIPESIMLGAFLCLFVAYFWLMNNAWTIMKISRYVRVTKLFDRRVVNQDNNIDMRKGPDRRFKPTPQQIESFHKGSGFFLSSLFKHNVQKKPSHIESKPGEDK